MQRQENEILDLIPDKTTRRDIKEYLKFPLLVAQQKFSKFLL